MSCASLRSKNVSGTIRAGGVARHTCRPEKWSVWTEITGRDVGPGVRVARIGNPAGPTLNPTRRCDDQAVSRSVLIVDDDPDFLALTASILAELGVEAVWTADSAIHALEVVREAQPDAVLVDVGLPDRHGIDLAYELCELPWRPRVVLTSSDTDAILALDPDDGRPDLPFLGKEELGSDTLQQALLDG
jgi:CheY-like chemotaxis protein